MTVHIVLDSTLGDYNGGEGYDTAGFPSKPCIVFQSLIAACSEITSGQDYHGYISFLQDDTCQNAQSKRIGGGVKCTELHCNFFIGKPLDFIKKSEYSINELIYKMFKNERK